jgi:hypothetical protein
MPEGYPRKPSTGDDFHALETVIIESHNLLVGTGQMRDILEASGRSKITHVLNECLLGMSLRIAKKK